MTEDMIYASQAAFTHPEALVPRKNLDICPPMAGNKWIPVFALLAWTAFASPIKVSLS